VPDRSPVTGAAEGQAADAVDGQRRAPRAGVAEGDELSERELGILRLLRSDLSLREIGRELYLSHNTVKTHVRRVYVKLGVGNRDDAVARARDLDVL
jgi:LuxR family transcriptional regulator, maltose regulon positive regulatory protein